VKTLPLSAATPTAKVKKNDPMNSTAYFRVAIPHCGTGAAYVAAASLVVTPAICVCPFNLFVQVDVARARWFVSAGSTRLAPRLVNRHHVDLMILGSGVRVDLMIFVPRARVDLMMFVPRV
jgi:hypothetical protein